MIVSSDLLDWCLVLRMHHRDCYASLTFGIYTLHMYRFSIFEIAREESLLQIHSIYRFCCFRCEESLDNSMFDRVDHRNKVIICSFFVYDEWILLGVPLKCHLLPQVSHTIDMLHPELVYTSESEASLELSKLFLGTTISQ